MIDVIHAIIHVVEELFLLFFIIASGAYFFAYVSADKHGLRYSMKMTRTHFTEHNVLAFLGIAAACFAAPVFVIHLMQEISSSEQPIRDWLIYCEAAAYVLALPNYALAAKHFYQESLDDRCSDYFIEKDNKVHKGNT